MNRIILSFLFFSVCVFQLKSQSYTEWVDSSFISLDRQDTIGCMLHLKQALRSEPANPMNSLLLNNLGTLQRSKGEYQNALTSFSAGLGLAPNTYRLLINRGKTYCDIDSVSLALADFEKVISSDENHEEALYFASLLYLSKQDTVRSENYFRRILSNNADSELGLSASVVWFKSRERYVEAEKSCNRLLSMNPLHPDYLLSRAEVFFLQKKQSKALLDIDKLLLKMPDHGEGYLLKARIELELFERSAARASLFKAQQFGVDPKLIAPLLRKCK